MRVARSFVWLAILALLVSACSIDAAELAATPDPTVSPADVATTTPAPVATEVPASAPTYSKLRVFVASETTDQVWVLEATAPKGQFALIGKIQVGRLPHQMAVSPDGRFVAVNNRLADTTSIIDPVAMKEIVRIKVGRSPHGITFSPDSKTLFVAHERDPFIMRFEVGTWKPLTPLLVGVPQHVLTIGTKRPNILLFTVTNSPEPDDLRAYDLVTNTITKFKVQDVHDAYYTPDQSEIWSSSSGFIDKPSDRMVIYDPDTFTVKEEIHLGANHYPFHTTKENQDGIYFMPDKSLMVLSDHKGPSLLWVDYKSRKIVAETKGIGGQPFHTTYDPLGERILLTTNVDGMVNVIDVNTKLVVQKVPVPFCHGIVSVGIP
ncbi:MAG TPA: beta-propeller fold lactonase family protein [Candidatus Limnocylindria bacterium]